MNKYTHAETALSGPVQVVAVEPYFYTALFTFIGKRLVIDTSRGSVNGIVVDVKPDHVVVREHDSTFFVRICEIVWFMPET